MASLDAGFAIAADRNPWIDPPRGKAAEFAKFKPDLYRDGVTAEQGRFGNATAHGREGQNVLFSDAHVDYECRAYCSLEDDNIYTSWDGQDKSRGVPPKLGSVPVDTTTPCSSTIPFFRPSERGDNPMRCEACGMENAAGTRNCASCGRLLDGQAPTVSVRVSRVALASSVFTLSPSRVSFRASSPISTRESCTLAPRSFHLTEWIILLAIAARSSWESRGCWRLRPAAAD